jgi:hypothetical protein
MVAGAVELDASLMSRRNVSEARASGKDCR